jgi:hypothetical protein
VIVRNMTILTITIMTIQDIRCPSRPHFRLQGRCLRDFWDPGCARNH